MGTPGPIEPSDLFIQGSYQCITDSPVGIQVKVLDFPLHDPVRHGVEVPAHNIATHTIGLDQRGTASIEWVPDANPTKVVGAVEGISQGSIHELGEQQTPEERSRPAGKPLVNGDDGPIVLLYLLFPQCQVGNEGCVEIPFNHRIEPFAPMNPSATAACRKMGSFNPFPSSVPVRSRHHAGENRNPADARSSESRLDRARR